NGLPLNIGCIHINQDQTRYGMSLSMFISTLLMHHYISSFLKSQLSTELKFSFYHRVR
uniref:Uncharacterized protein n=1 Tax=Aegilops tauschii subsp. strangulata TaxID=200361 RepID=A0A453B1U7_AEGTS